MDKLAVASINSFGIPPKADVPPEEPIFVLTSGQLQDIITRAIQPLQDELSELRATVARQGEDMTAMKATVAEQKADYESMNFLRCEDFVNVTRRVRALETKRDEPGETETARAEKIKKYLNDQPGRRASYESLRGHLGIDKFALNDAIRALMETSPGRYGIAPSPGDKRKRTLVMLPR